MMSSRALPRWTFFCACALGAPPAHARAQTISDTLDLRAPRPEAWAMKLVGSELMMMTGVARTVKPWSFQVGLEAGWIPPLSSEQRRIGFNGQKEESVNRTPVYGRARVSIGLRGGISLALGYIPPTPINGIRPNHLSASLGVPVVSQGAWRLGARIHGQVGEVSGDITCDQAEVAAGDDSVRNPYHCEARSHDDLHLRGGGIELGAAVAMTRRVEPFLAVGWNHFDNDIQVDARYSGLHDRQLLRNSGSTVSVAAGVAYRTPGDNIVRATAFYTPLHVEREGVEMRDGLFNLRLALFHRFP